MGELQKLCEQAPVFCAASEQYVGEPTFGVKKVKLELPGKFDGKPAALNTWLFDVEQYCPIVGIRNYIDMVQLAVPRLEKNAHTWQQQLIVPSTEFELNHLGWNEFKVEIEGAFTDVDRELKFRQQLAALRQTASIAAYFKEFQRVALELGNQVPDDSALIFMYIEWLKLAVKMQVLWAWPSMLVEAKQLVQRADIAIFTSGQHQYKGQPRHHQGCNYQWLRFFQPSCPPSGPIPMDLGMVQGQPRMPPHGSQGSENGNGSGQRIGGQCFHYGRPGHIAGDFWHYTGARPQQHQGRSAFMGTQGYNGQQCEYGVILPPPPKTWQPSVAAAETQPKN